jgi:uncharacterized protein YjlB
MPLLEDVKKFAEKVTGIGRPKAKDVRALLRARKANLHAFRDDGETPNNPTLPLIHYRSPVELDEAYDPAAIFEELFAANGWTGAWRDGVYDFLHFHTRTHEVLGIARGHAGIQFGGKRGRVIAVRAGDVIVVPAGTGHRRKCASRDLLVVGAYPKNGGSYDEPKPEDVEPETARADIKKVPLPPRDPVFGGHGGVRTIWAARWKSRAGMRS